PVDISRLEHGPVSRLEHGPAPLGRVGHCDDILDAKAAGHHHDERRFHRHTLVDAERRGSGPFQQIGEEPGADVAERVGVHEAGCDHASSTARAALEVTPADAMWVSAVTGTPPYGPCTIPVRARGVWTVRMKDPASAVVLARRASMYL